VADQRVFVVDSEVTVLEAVGKTLGSLALEVTCFVQAKKCLERLRSEKCDLLVADVKISDMDGIEFVSNVRRHAPWVPVLAITDHDDVPTAVRAIKAGAVDIVEKPLDRSELAGKVMSILQENALTNTCVDSPLTPVETRVLKLVVGGKTNREMAYLLGRSVRTIEWHRANVMQKLGVDSLLGLIKRAAVLGIIHLNGEGEHE